MTQDNDTLAAAVTAAAQVAAGRAVQFRLHSPHSSSYHNNGVPEWGECQ